MENKNSHHRCYVAIFNDCDNDCYFHVSLLSTNALAIDLAGKDIPSSYLAKCTPEHSLVILCGRHQYYVKEKGDNSGCHMTHNENIPCYRLLLSWLPAASQTQTKKKMWQ